MAKEPSPGSWGWKWADVQLLHFSPRQQAPNASVLVFFHNAVGGRGGEGSLDLNGSFLAAVGNLIVVTAGYRVGVFGFLSSGEWLGTADP